jgi:Na+-translocating ferredoxin:NAD+ oxidoreductase RnfG subunit
MNQKIAHMTNDHKTAIALVVLAAVAAVLVASTAALGTGHIALADSGSKTKVFKNSGISVPTDTQQKQECETAGGNSPVTGSCTATSTNTIDQSGGVMSEEK